MIIAGSTGYGMESMVFEISQFRSKQGQNENLAGNRPEFKSYSCIEIRDKKEVPPTLNTQHTLHTFENQDDEYTSTMKQKHDLASQNQTFGLHRGSFALKVKADKMRQSEPIFDQKLHRSNNHSRKDTKSRSKSKRKKSKSHLVSS